MYLTGDAEEELREFDPEYKRIYSDACILSEVSLTITG